MYSGFNRKSQIYIRGSLVFVWVCIAAGALGGLILTPVTIASELGVIAEFSALVALVCSLAATYGILRNRYRFEWVAAWLAGAGVAPYCFGLWGLVIFGGVPTRLQQAAYITALFGFTLHRAISCSVYAKRLRDLHRILSTGPTETI